MITDTKRDKKMPISLRIKGSNLAFIKILSQKSGKPQSTIADEALENFRKYNLWKELREGFSKKTTEDVSKAMEGFQNYLSLIEKRENEELQTI